MPPTTIDQDTTGEDDRAAAEEVYQQAYQATRDQAVTVLTAAVRLRHPSRGPVDFVDLLTGVLAVVTANVGSVATVLAGRPGSWEADLVGQLLYATLGCDEENLAWRRTEPLRVTLNVAELIEDHLGLPGLGDTHEAIEDRHTHLMDDAEVSDDEYDTAVEARDRDLDQATGTYTTAYADYAATFTDAVHQAHARLDQISVPLVVDVDADPISPWWDTHPGIHHGTDPVIRNPTARDTDPLVWHLWHAAVTTTPTPPTGYQPAPHTTNPDTSHNTAGHDTSSATAGHDTSRDGHVVEVPGQGGDPS